MERLSASAKQKLSLSVSPSAEQICFCSVHIFTQGWQTHSPPAHRCYSRKLCKKWRHWEKSLAHKPFQHSDPSHCMLLCSFLSRFFSLFSFCLCGFVSISVCKVHYSKVRPHALVPQNPQASHLCTISIRFASVLPLQQRWNIWQKSLIACLVSAAARSTINLERLFLCLRGFFCKCALVLMCNDQMKLPPIFIALQFEARLLLSNAETPLYEITVQFWKVETGSRQFRCSASTTMDCWPWWWLLGNGGNTMASSETKGP